MQYIIEPIGAHFADKDIPNLESRFNRRATEGYRFHSVFQISQPGGCFGLGRPVTTYLAIYEKIS